MVVSGTERRQGFLLLPKEPDAQLSFLVARMNASVRNDAIRRRLAKIIIGRARHRAGYKLKSNPIKASTPSPSATKITR
jgi:hypothetical protein